jgi:transposase-like protein
MFAAEIRRRRVDRMLSGTHWQWHLDEVFVKINGETHYLWRAVDHEPVPAITKAAISILPALVPLAGHQKPSH